MVDLIELCNSSTTAPETTKAAVAQHICVSTNGYLEVYIRSSVKDIFRPRCDQNALRVISRTLDGYYNFKSEKVCKLFSDIWPEKTEQLRVYFKTNDQFSDAIGSIVGNKNTIAHRGSSSVTIARVQPWLETIINHLDEFDQTCFG